MTEWFPLQNWEDRRHTVVLFIELRWYRDNTPLIFLKYIYFENIRGFFILQENLSLDEVNLNEVNSVKVNVDEVNLEQCETFLPYEIYFTIISEKRKIIWVKN